MVTKPRRIRQAESREEMKAALNLVELSKAARRHRPDGVDLSQPIHGIAQSEHTVFINNKTVVSSSIEALSAMQKAAQEMNQTIQAELKRRDASISSKKPDVAGPGHNRDGDAEHPVQNQTGASTNSCVESTIDKVDDGFDGSNDDREKYTGEGTAKDSAPATSVDGDRSIPDSTADNDDDSTVADIVFNIVETAASSANGKEVTSMADTVANTASKVDKKIDQEPAAMESALTPVSEAAKDGEEIPAPPTNGINPAAPNPNGIETPEPEANSPGQEQAVSPAEAMDMD